MYCKNCVSTLVIGSSRICFNCGSRFDYNGNIVNSSSEVKEDEIFEKLSESRTEEVDEYETYDIESILFDEFNKIILLPYDIGLGISYQYLCIGSARLIFNEFLKPAVILKLSNFSKEELFNTILNEVIQFNLIIVFDLSYYLSRNIYLADLMSKYVYLLMLKGFTYRYSRFKVRDFTPTKEDYFNKYFSSYYSGEKNRINNVFINNLLGKINLNIKHIISADTLAQQWHEFFLCDIAKTYYIDKYKETNLLNVIELQLFDYWKKNLNEWMEKNV